MSVTPRSHEPNLMLINTAYENSARCMERARSEVDGERSRAWLYTGRLWRRFAVELAVMGPQEAEVEAGRLLEIENVTRRLGTSLQ